MFCLRYPSLGPGAIALILALITPALLPHPAETAPLTSVTRRTLAAAVRIDYYGSYVPDGREWRCSWQIGSGTIISPDGYVLTNQHVVDAIRKAGTRRHTCIHTDGRRVQPEIATEYAVVRVTGDGGGQPDDNDGYLAEIVRESSNPDLDVALLRIVARYWGQGIGNRSFPYLRIGDSDALRELDELYVIGYPGIGEGSRITARGIVSGFVVNSEGQRVWIWTDAETSFGNSGGTAVNLDGELVGLPTRVTWTGCKPDDVNGDSQIDEWEKCRPAGGSLGMVTPINLARSMIRRALGSALPEIATSGLDPNPAAPDQLGQPSITAFDATGAWLPGGAGATHLAGCVSYGQLAASQTDRSTWYRDDRALISEAVTLPAGDRGTICVPLAPAGASGLLAPGAYRWEIIVNGASRGARIIVPPPEPSNA